MDSFWDMIAAQLKELEKAKNADDVIRALGGKENASSGDAFFGGGGGDETVLDALYEAGWSPVWIEADYYFCMKAPDGSMVSYVEGDIYRGNSR